MTDIGQATVAIVGRPNVGKSTIFNRLVGRRQSIVHNQPGVTRDRVVGQAPLGDGAWIHLIDTGGLTLGEEPLGLNEQVLLAVEESDVLLFVTDGNEGLIAADEEVLEVLRAYNKDMILAVNKGDTHRAQEGYTEFYALGIPTVLLISAEHNRGFVELREAIEEAVPEPIEPTQSDAPRVAIVGRPNVGKSSLLNRLVGSNRALVSPIAGTTRDPVDTLVEADGQPWLLVDTAGIRRRAKVSGAAEQIAVMMARRQLERAELAILVIDATAGVTFNDLAIAGLIVELGRAVIVVVNKWDLLTDEEREDLDLAWPRLEEVLFNPPRVNTSALTGRAVDKIWNHLKKSHIDYHVRVGTGELNRLLETAVERHQPPQVKGKTWRLYYATQVGTGPPTFMLFANQNLSRSDSYRRYLSNRMKDHLLLKGIPIRLVIKRRKP